MVTPLGGTCLAMGTTVRHICNGDTSIDFFCGNIGRIVLPKITNWADFNVLRRCWADCNLLRHCWADGNLLRHCWADYNLERERLAGNFQQRNGRSYCTYLFHQHHGGMNSVDYCALFKTDCTRNALIRQPH